MLNEDTLFIYLFNLNTLLSKRKKKQYGKKKKGEIVDRNFIITSFIGFLQWVNNDV